MDNLTLIKNAIVTAMAAIVSVGTVTDDPLLILEEVSTDFPVLKIYTERLEHEDLIDITAEEIMATIVLEGADYVQDGENGQTNANAFLQDVRQKVKDNRTWGGKAKYSMFVSTDFFYGENQAGFLARIQVVYEDTKT